MARRGTITVDVEADLDERSVKKVGKEAKALLEVIDTQLDVGVELDREQVVKVHKQLQDLLKTFRETVDIDPKIDEKAHAELRAEMNRLMASLISDVTIGAELSPGAYVSMQRQVRSLVAQVEKTNKVKLKTEVDKTFSGEVLTFFRHLGTDAADQFGRGARTGLGAFRVGDLLALAAPAASAISALGGAFTALTSSIAYASAASLSYVGILGSLTQAALVGKLAFKGFGTAVTAATPAAFIKATEGMPPAMRDAAAATRGLRDEWDVLRDAVQGAVFKDLSDDISRLATTLIPEMQKGFTGTGEVLNRLFDDLLKFVTSTSFVTRFGDAVEGNNRIFDNLRQAVVPFLDGVLNVFLALQPAAQRFSESIADLARGFADWSAEAGRAEAIDAFMRRASESASLLFELLGNVFKSLGNVFAATKPAGDAFLQMLIDVTQRFEDFSGSAEGKNKIAEWAETGVATMKQFGQILGGLGELFAHLSSPTLLQGINDVLISMLDTLNRFNIGAVVDAVGSLLSVVAPLLGPILAVSAAFTGFAALLFAFRKTVLPVINIIRGLFAVLSLGVGAAPAAVILGVAAAMIFAYKKSEVFRNAVKKGFAEIKAAIVPVLEQISDLVNNQLIPAWQKVAPVVIPILEKIGVFLVNTLVAGIKGVIQAFSGFITIIKGIFNVLGGIFTGDFGKAWEGVKQIFSGAMNVIAGLFKAWLNFGIFGAVRTIFVKGLTALIKGGWNLLVMLFKNGIKLITLPYRLGFQLLLRVGGATMNALRAVISRVWGTIRGVFSGAINAVRGTVSRGFNAARNLASSAMNGLLNIVTRVLGRVKGAFDGLSNLGSKMWSGMTNGARSAINGVVSMLNSLIGIMNKAISGFNKLPKVNIPSIPKIPQLARGTANFGGGLAVVGEQGPELVEMPKGSRVTPNRQTEAMLGGKVEINQNFYGPTTSGGRLRELDWTLRYATKGTKPVAAGAAT